MFRGVVRFYEGGEGMGRRSRPSSLAIPGPALPSCAQNALVDNIIKKGNSAYYYGRVRHPPPPVYSPWPCQ